LTFAGQNSRLHYVAGQLILVSAFFRGFTVISGICRALACFAGKRL
jgi:hypothetical protein